MNRYFTNRLAARVTLALCGCLSFVSHPRGATAARMPGAPRALTVRFPEDAPVTLDSSLSQAAVGPATTPSDGGTAVYPLYFTRTATTRNIYRADLKVTRKATPRPDDDDTDESRRDLNGDTRFVTTVAPIVATPLTKLTAPFWAEGGVPLKDGKTVLCVTNALASTRDRASGFDQIARIDVRSGVMRALTPADAHYGTPVISPDGKAFAYSCDRSGTDDIYVAPLDSSPSNPRSQRVARLVRRPVWLDNDALVVENLLPGSDGLARINLREASKSPATARRLWSRGGQATFDGRLLCVAAPHLAKDTKGDAEIETQLYLLASDGSGARALAGTDGANEPLFAPDGSFLLFDAPATNTPEATRGLWIIPMRRVAPVAQLDRVKLLVGNTYAVIGTAFSNDDAPAATVEWGEGRTPSRWNALPTAAPTHASQLARWTPPSQRGEWTLRLRVEDADGDSSQSLIYVSLPTSTAPPVVAPPLFANPSLSPPAVPQAPVPAVPTPASPPVSPVPVPLTVLPADRAPESRAFPPMSAPVAAKPAAPRAAPRPAPQRKPAPAAPPAPTPPARDNAVAGDAAVLTVTGIPYSVAPGETVAMSAGLRNTGRTGWKVSGDGAVRLLVRWHDTKTLGRTRWAVRWIRANVAPGGSTKLDFSIPAPTKPGDYILRFSLVRVGPDGYSPPPYSTSASDRYPGEFGVATTTMPVRP